MGYKHLTLTEKPQAIIGSLHEVLDPVVVTLIDAQERMLHLSRTSEWFSWPGELTDTGLHKGVCEFRAPINDRWTLHVLGLPSLHPDAERLVMWAAEKLSPYFVRSTQDDPLFSPRRGGGNSGPAELGIPVAWARRRPS